MDVETAVQLERLEEVERALLALDPGQFVRREEASSAASAAAASELSSLSPPTAVESHATAQFGDREQPHGTP